MTERRTHVLVFGFYLLLAAVHTWPLLPQLSTLIVADPGDPVLNASILWRNAHTIPFTLAWWNAPPFYPATGVNGFTENLVGLGLFTTPVVWLTGNPIAAYNSAVFLSWPLSAFAAYLLVRHLTGRSDAGIVAGLAFGFTPYRMMELSHIQMLASFWLPLCLLGLHGYMDDGRRRWLVLVAAAWILNGLTNGHFLLFGAVFVHLWLTYFASRRPDFSRARIAIAALVLASVPLIPVLLRYQAIHDQYGLSRSEAEVLAFSATPQSWFEVSSDTWFWPHLVPEGRDNLFPGITALVLLTLGVFVALRRGERATPLRPQLARRLRLAFALGVVIATLAIAGALVAGPWSVTVAGILVRMRDLNRALLVLALCGAPLLWLTPCVRAAIRRRSPLVFYSAMVLVTALLSCGPVLTSNGQPILSPAPYRWLMAIPGFDEIRVPLRFWMLGVMTLSVAAGLAFTHLARERAVARALLIAALAGVTLDGTIHTFRLATPPVLWTAVEPPTRSVPILELPIGGGWEQDWAATFRAAGHGRRVVNGVSGYNPPHYAALASGLERRDPEMLTALASLGPLDVIVNREADPGGVFERYVAVHPLASPLMDDGRRTAFGLTPSGEASSGEKPSGAALPIVAARAVRHDADARFMTDDDLTTLWADAPQQLDQWIELDLGSATDIGGIAQALGDHPLEFPRRLSIAVSPDGTTWTTAWSGATAAHAFLALAEQPRQGWLSIRFAPVRARFVRINQLDSAPARWTVAEIRVYRATADAAVPGTAGR